MSQSRRRQDTKLKIENNREHENDLMTIETTTITLNKRILRGNIETNNKVISNITETENIDLDTTPARRTRNINHSSSTSRRKSKTRPDLSAVSQNPENLWPVSTPRRTRNETKLIHDVKPTLNDEDNLMFQDTPNSIYMTPHQRPRTIPKMKSPSIRDYQKIERRLFPQTLDYRQDGHYNEK